MTAGHWLMLAALAVTNVIALSLMIMGQRESAVERLALLERRAKLCLLVVALGSGAGVAGSASQAYAAVRADSVVDPASKARELAEGISGAMNCIAAGVVFTPLPLAATISLFSRRRRIARSAADAR